MASDHARHGWLDPEVLRTLILVSGVGSGSKVLEVGCGTGDYVIALESAVGCTCWGIDLSPQMLAKARERSESVSFQSGQAEKLDFPSDFFDLVFSVDVIHHLGDRRAFFQEAHRVLRARGSVCAITDSEWIICHREPLLVYFPETIEIDLDRYPRIAELRAVMKEAGFSGITESSVEFTYEVTDIQPYRDRCFSCLHLIPEDAFERGIDRLDRDLRTGPIPCVSRYVLLWGAKQGT